MNSSLSPSVWDHLKGDTFLITIPFRSRYSSPFLRLLRVGIEQSTHPAASFDRGATVVLFGDLVWDQKTGNVGTYRCAYFNTINNHYTNMSA